MQVETRKSSEVSGILSEVLIEKEESALNKTANEIFASYAELVRLHNDYSQKLTELQKRKITLENTWAYYLFYREENDAYLSRCNYISQIKTYILTIPCFVFLGNGLSQHNGMMVGSALGGLFIGLPVMFVFDSLILPCMPCITQILDEHKIVCRKITQIQDKRCKTTQLIKLINVFAEFCKEWSQVGQNIESTDIKPLFKKLRKLSNVDNSAIENIVSRAFLRSAPLFLIEKIGTLLHEGNTVSSWQKLKHTPKWGRDDQEFWAKVNMINPTHNDYIQFFKIKETAQEGDPDNWQAWMENKLKTFVAACN